MEKNLEAITQRILDGAEADKSKLESTTALVQPLLSDGKVEDAIRAANDCYGVSHWPDELTRLFKQFPPVEVCSDCGTQLQTKWDFRRWEFIPCQECKRKALIDEVAEKMDAYLTHRGLPAMFLKARMDKVPTSIRELLSKKQSIYLYGGCGVGKTYCQGAKMRAVATENAVRRVKANISGNSIAYYDGAPLDRYPLFASLSEILLNIRQTFKKGSEGSEQSIISKYADVDYLLLDDVGVEKPSEWALQTIYLIIDRRYREMKSTFFSSNFSLSQLAKRLGDRITSRIAGMCEVIELKGKDRRL